VSIAVDPNAAVNDLADRFWEGILERNPMWATLLGDERYNDRWPDLGAAGRAADEAAYRSALDEARRIPADGLEPEQVITRDLIVLISENHLEELAHKRYQLAIDHMSGPQVWPADYAQYQPADTPERLEKLLARHAAYPAMIEQYIETLDEGVRDGRTSAAMPVRRAIEQIERLLALAPDAHPASTLAPVADEDRPRLVAGVEQHLYAGLRRLRDYLVAEYEPHARPEPGIWSTPDGEEAYRIAIRVQTSLDTTAEEVHAFGMADLEAIEAEMDDIARRLGHADRHAMRSALAADPANHTDDPQTIVRLAQDQTERAYAEAPKYFGLLPSANCYVKAVEEYREADSPPAFYMPPSLDRSRQGQYYINTYQPTERQLHRVASITFHEATPGHHFQIAIEMELTGLPPFRTLGARLAGEAYVEGWGLYTERLADEMGLYSADLDRMGMLSYDAWRASRLVVDTGIHVKGWTRTQAQDYMRDHTALTVENIGNEVDRYISWPGQALAYKVGQLEILRLRREAETALGARFDIKAFHDVILGSGAVTLPVLRGNVEAWIKQPR
jgi:uncharacterized protein (DUF885 family)